MKIVSIIVSLFAVAAFANPTAPAATATTTTTTTTPHAAAAGHEMGTTTPNKMGDASKTAPAAGKVKKVEKKTTTETH